MALVVHMAPCYVLENAFTHGFPSLVKKVATFHQWQEDFSSLKTKILLGILGGAQKRIKFTEKSSWSHGCMNKRSHMAHGGKPYGQFCATVAHYAYAYEIEKIFDRNEL